MYFLRLISLTILCLFSTTAFASWEYGIREVAVSTTSCSATRSVALDYYSDAYSGFNNDPYYVVSDGDCYYFSPKYQQGYTSYVWTADSPITIPDGVGLVYNSPYTDDQCAAQYSGSYQIPGTTAGNIDSVSAGACTLASDGVAVCTSSGCFADWLATSSGETNVPGGSSPSTDTSLPDYLTETDDPSSCPSGYMGAGGKTYCVDQAAIDDGSISIIGGDLSYPPTDTDDDGVPDANDPTPGTGETVGGGSDGSGGSTGGTTTEPGGSYGGGGQFGDPSGSAGDGDGDGTQDGACSVFLGDAVCNWMFGVPAEPVQPSLPVETISASDQTIAFNSGLSTTATCPPPESTTVSFGNFSYQLEIPYTHICTFAEMIRGLVIAAAYMAAAFITYRGVVA